MKTTEATMPTKKEINKRHRQIKKVKQELTAGMERFDAYISDCMDQKEVSELQRLYKRLESVVTEIAQLHGISKTRKAAFNSEAKKQAA